MQLTMDQINQLASMGFSMNGVAEGSEATAEEMAALKIQPDVGPDVSDDLSAPAVTPQSVATDLAGAVPTAAPVSAPQMTPNAVSAAVQAVPAASAVTQEQLSAAPGGSSFMDAIFGPKESSDKFSNLNRQQRMMLAFGAIKDAGFALQGKEGNAFGTTLKAINDQIDMGRKAAAVQAQRDIMQSAIGPESGEMSFDQRRQRLQQALASGGIDAQTFTAMMTEISRQEKTEIGEQGRGQAAVSTLRDIDSIISMIDEDPTMTTGTWAWMTRGLPMLPAGKTQALVDSVVSSLALDSLKALKATGATMGALNQSELEILKTELARVDLAAGPDFVKDQLGKVQGHYRRIISDLYDGASEEDAAKITAFLGLDKRPSWAGGSSQPSGGQREGETDAEFLKRMREGRG